MSLGALSEYFDGVAFKRLSAVEAHPERSNQHEFGGVQQLRALLGEQRARFPADFIYLADVEEDVVSATGFVTWYDARERHSTRSEYRLYFPSTAVSERAAEGDMAVITRRRDGSLLVAIADEGSTAENQLCWLFTLADVADSLRQEMYPALIECSVSQRPTCWNSWVWRSRFHHRRSTSTSSSAASRGSSPTQPPFRSLRAAHCQTSDRPTIRTLRSWRGSSGRKLFSERSNEVSYRSACERGSVPEVMTSTASSRSLFRCTTAGSRGPATPLRITWNRYSATTASATRGIGARSGNRDPILSSRVSRHITIRLSRELH
jgi:hypothetical protein